jgi:hypothetical protein
MGDLDGRKKGRSFFCGGDDGEMRVERRYLHRRMGLGGRLVVLRLGKVVFVCGF